MEFIGIDVHKRERQVCLLAARGGGANPDFSPMNREHGRSPHPAEVGPMKKVECAETGVVFEQAVEVEDEQGRRLRPRQIELQWDERVLTNVPAERRGAKEVAPLRVTPRARQGAGCSGLRSFTQTWICSITLMLVPPMSNFCSLKSGYRFSRMRPSAMQSLSCASASFLRPLESRAFAES